MAKPLDPTKREKILQTAIELFVQRGYEGTSTAAIAEQAEMSSSHMYIYFKNKKDLMLTAVRRMMEEHTQRFEELSGKSAGMGVEQYIDWCFDELETIRPRVLFIIRCVITPSLKKTFEAFDFDYSNAFLPYLQGWPEQDAANTARALMALSDSYFLVGDTVLPGQ
ncbi:MAG: TetR/AcrR family transcriptional regulator [Christensenellales bacterium]|jgi:AcrR family transcriptional regulator